MIAAALKDEADRLARKFRNVEALLLNVIDRPDMLEDLVRKSDMVISLLPYTLHPSVAGLCVRHGVNMVTASYQSPMMQELDKASGPSYYLTVIELIDLFIKFDAPIPFLISRAQNNHVTILNEIGLDPGIDHLLAMECVDEVHRNGGKVLLCHRDSVIPHFKVIPLL